MTIITQMELEEAQLDKVTIEEFTNAPAGDVTSRLGQIYPNLAKIAADAAAANLPQVASDFAHDDLSGVSVNAHRDWALDQGIVNISPDNYTNTVYVHPTTDGNKHVPATSGETEGTTLTIGAGGILEWSAASGTYTHPTGDGNKHVPANSTTNNGKVLTASSVAGICTWETVPGGGDALTTNDLSQFAGSTATTLSGTNTGDQTIPTSTSDLTNDSGFLTSETSHPSDSLVTQDIINIGNLSGINTGDYVHPTADGSKHVPANGTSNDGKVLTASGVAGTYNWEAPIVAAGSRTIMDMDKTGLVDITATFSAYLASGGYYFVPEGDYLLAGAGAGLGGIDVEVLATLDILCHPNAVFHGGNATNNLDNNVITLLQNDTVSVSGEYISIKWVGGQGNMTYTKNGDGSTVPHHNLWPVQHPGTTTNADFLSVRGEYGGSSNWKQGFNEVHIEGLLITGGNHGMQSAGGDAGIFVDGGAEKTVIKGNYGKNLRGSLFYMSGGADTSLAARGLLVEENLAVNCFNGGSVKRGFTDFVVRDNIAVNCVQNVQTNTVTVGPRRGVITGNIAHNCFGNVRCDNSHDLVVTGNVSSEVGFLLEGTYPAIDTLPLLSDGSPYGGSFLHPEVVSLNGCDNCLAADNLFTGINSAYTLGESKPVHISINTFPITGDDIPTHNCVIQNNVTTDGYYAIRDQTDSGYTLSTKTVAKPNYYLNNSQINNHASGGNLIQSDSYKFSEHGKDTMTFASSVDSNIDQSLVGTASTGIKWKQSWSGEDSAGAQQDYGSISINATNVTAGSLGSQMQFRSSGVVTMTLAQDRVYMSHPVKFLQVTSVGGYNAATYEGHQVYNTTTNQMMYSNGTSWIAMNA